MAVLWIRTIVIYLFLIIILRIMGKRQIGELEVSDLITTFLLSELATMPLSNNDIPLFYTVIPITLILFFEVTSAFFSTKSKWFKKFLCGNPSYLIKKGQVDQKELQKLRMSMEELLTALRQAEVSNISSVDYAILEVNGKLSVMKKNSDDASGLSHPVIVDGRLDQYQLSLSGKNEQWIFQQLKKQKYSLKDVFLLTVDDSGTVNIIGKEKR